MWAHAVTSNSDTTAKREQCLRYLRLATGPTGDDLESDVCITDQVLNYLTQIGNRIAEDIIQLSSERGMWYDQLSVDLISLRLRVRTA